MALYFIYQRYNFESKSQRARRNYGHCLSCISYTKGTILKANHNTAAGMPSNRKLYFIYQRYNFESKSQLWQSYICSWYCCISYTKGTILKANHNFLKTEIQLVLVVFHIPKVQFWKQITTFIGMRPWIVLLYFIYQRYNFESKSQQ